MVSQSGPRSFELISPKWPQVPHFSTFLSGCICQNDFQKSVSTYSLSTWKESIPLNHDPPTYASCVAGILTPLSIFDLIFVNLITDHFRWMLSEILHLMSTMDGCLSVPTWVAHMSGTHEWFLTLWLEFSMPSEAEAFRYQYHSCPGRFGSQ
jgi:hypothetical protein